MVAGVDAAAEPLKRLGVSEPVPEEPGATTSWRDRAWVTSTYFAEGYPYTIVNNLAEILFKELGASLGAVGLTALFHLPWNLKFLWGPFVDHYETKRRWLLGMEVLCTVVLVALAFVLSTGALMGALSVLFFVLALLSATHDIAIDGFYLEGLDERGQSEFVGYRAMAYRLATMLLAGPGLVLIGWVGWKIGFVVMALLMGAITAFHARLLPRVEEPKAPLRQLLSSLFRFRVLLLGALIASLIVAERQLGFGAALLGHAVSAAPALGRISVGGWVGLSLAISLVALLLFRRPLRARLARGDGRYGAAFVDFLEQPKVGIILAFVCTFRTGESFLMKMKWPFFDDVVHLSLEQYGFANGTVGLVASFSATMLGGWLISRHGLRRWIWPFVIGQNALNLLYVGLSSGWFGATPNLTAVTVVITLERIGEGLGTAVFMVYLMRCCDPRHKAAHMAILTALMSIGFTIAGMVSGFLAEAIGFSRYFLFSFLATVPGMLLLFFVPHLDGREAPDVTPAAS
jgi:MFS transporter, PAT family, beta-lactamase induction signal transducer AmpG